MEIIKIKGFASDQKVDIIINSANGFLLLGSGGSGRIRKKSNILNKIQNKEFYKILDSLRPEIKNWYLSVYSKNKWDLTLAQLESLRILSKKKENKLNEFRRGTAVIQEKWNENDARIIIHAITMSYKLVRDEYHRKKGTKYLLQKSIIKALDLAKGRGDSIAIPIMISRINYGISVKESEKVIINAIKKYSFSKVILCYDNETTQKYFNKIKD